MSSISKRILKLGSVSVTSDIQDILYNYIQEVGT